MRSMVGGPTAQPADCVRRPSTTAFGGGPPPPDGRGRNGFTLVELLIVLVIMGLISAVVVVAMPDPRGSVTIEAERFAARAKAAQDRAIIDARTMSMRVTGAGYGFDMRERGQWRPMGGKPFDDQTWGEGIQALVPGGAMRVVFDPTGLTDPASVVLTRGDERISVEIGHDGTVRVAA